MTHQIPLEPHRSAARPASGIRDAVSAVDAIALAPELDGVDCAYLDPPYNQHSYFANYHVWETLMRWDAPETYGVACKRIDCRSTKSAFTGSSRRRTPPQR